MWCILVFARAPTYTNQYHLHSFFPDGCLPVLTVLRVSHQERRSVSVTGRCGVVCAHLTYTYHHQQEQTPSYLPSYTRLGHAIPGSKTVSVGVCVGGVCLGRKERFKVLLSLPKLPTNTNQHRPVSPNPKLSVYRSMW